MLLTITTTHRPATDLGYLLYKNPARAQAFELSFGRAHVFYPEASEERCTAALLLEVDPVGLVRGRRGPAGEGRVLEQYVNDRPYAATSFLSVALAGVLRSAMTGESRDRPELAASPIPLEARIAALPCRGGDSLARRLFEPLGYSVTVEPYPLDETHPEWGTAPHAAVTLRAERRLCELLTHLYVLIPVLDNDKHYWVSDDELEKLMRHGEGWLAGHPERKLITRRYLKHRRSLIAEALARLAEDAAPEPEASEEQAPSGEEVIEARIGLNEQRHAAVVAVLRESGARSVLDLGCGEGKMLRSLMGEPQFTRITGVDVSYRALEVAQDRLRLDRLPPMQRERVQLLHGALTYRDRRLAGYDAAAVVEVIEHLDPPRLSAFERVLFEHARPGTVVLTTPNVEYNSLYGRLPAGRFRHPDHRFEWTRAQLQTWAETVAGRFGYAVHFAPVGPEDPVLGSPTQMALFSRQGGSSERDAA